MDIGTQAPRYSVVVPMYRTKWFTAKIILRIQELEERLGAPIELVCVDDGCPEASGIEMEAQLKASGRTGDQVIFLSRNFGSHQACRAGLSVARGRTIAIMAADLQEPTSLVLQMFQELDTGECDVVVGARNGRKDPIGTKITSAIFWSLYRTLIVKNMPRGGVDMFGCTDAVAAQIVALEERNSNLLGLLFWVGYRRKVIRYDRLSRQHGKSGWSFRKRITLMMDSIYAFTDLPIKVLGSIGIAGMVTSLILAGWIIIARLLGSITEIGYTALMVTILASTSVLIFGLSIVGDYVFRTFENSKGRPGFMIRRKATPNLEEE